MVLQGPQQRSASQSALPISTKRASRASRASSGPALPCQPVSGCSNCSWHAKTALLDLCSIPPSSLSLAHTRTRASAPAGQRACRSRWARALFASEPEGASPSHWQCVCLDPCHGQSCLTPRCLPATIPCKRRPGACNSSRMARPTPWLRGCSSRGQSPSRGPAARPVGRV